MMLQKLLTAFAVLLLAGTSQAGLLPVDVNVGREGTHTRFDYSVILQSDTVLRTGDYFTVYDFAGFVPNSNTQPANFSFTTATTGKTPAHVQPSDDPSIPNLTFTYTGSDTEVGELALGSFTALSRYTRTREDYFTGQTHRELDGHLNSNITDTLVPVPCHPPAVPEPASIVLLALGLPLALGVRAFRKARACVA